MASKYTKLVEFELWYGIGCIAWSVSAAYYQLPFLHRYGVGVLFLLAALVITVMRVVLTRKVKFISRNIFYVDLVLFGIAMYLDIFVKFSDIVLSGVNIALLHGHMFFLALFIFPYALSAKYLHSSKSKGVSNGL